jgi:hypothetical protein
MHVPTFATMQDFLGMGTDRAHGAPAERAVSSPCPEAAREEAAPSGVPAGSAFDLHRATRAVPFLLLFGLVACKGHPEGAGATPPASASSVFIGERAGAASARADSATPAAGSALADAVRLRRTVDELAARVARLDPDAFARPVGAGCAAACDLLGVKAVTFAAGEARCTCGRLPSLGTHPATSRAARAQKAARLETVAGPGARIAAADAVATTP